MRALPEWADEWVKPHEGCRLKAYHDPVGYPTQGYGHLLSRKKWEDLSKYPDITMEQAIDWLRQDLAKAGRSVLRLITVPLTDNQYVALIDFTFNCGAGNLQVSTLRKVINRGEYEAVPDQFRRWVYASGVKLPGLVKRRNAEALLFMED